LTGRAEAGSPDKQLRIKFGIDPTAPSLHLGHLSILRQIKKMQRAGHVAVVVLGDFTAAIGDPTGRSRSRKPATAQAISANADRIEAQLRSLLEPENLEIVRNGGWLGEMPLRNFLFTASAFGVGKILARRDFKSRIAAGDRVGLDEILYPILQGTDSVAVRADVEVGGADQRFNMLVGRTLQKRSGQNPQRVVELPLLPAKGGVKMGKSAAGCIPLDLPRETLKDKLMSTPDESVDAFLRALTDIDPEAIADPREKQRALAESVLEQINININEENKNE